VFKCSRNEIFASKKTPTTAFKKKSGNANTLMELFEHVSSDDRKGENDF
jgi:hypothetical protein